MKKDFCALSFRVFGVFDRNLTEYKYEYTYVNKSTRTWTSMSFPAVHREKSL